MRPWSGGAESGGGRRALGARGAVATDRLCCGPSACEEEEEERGVARPRGGSWPLRPTCACCWKWGWGGGGGRGSDLFPPAPCSAVLQGAQLDRDRPSVGCRLPRWDRVRAGGRALQPGEGSHPPPSEKGAFPTREPGVGGLRALMMTENFFPFKYLFF